MSTLKVNALQNTSGTALNFIKQIVSTQNTTAFTGTQTSYTDLFSASITPSATSSKILILPQLAISKENNHSALARLVRQIGSGSFNAFGGGVGTQSNHDDNVWWNIRTTLYSINPFTVPYLDSPSTTSAVTYKAQIRTTNSSNGYAVNRTMDSGNDAFNSNAASSITLIEVAG
tara:strand:- start:1105 stop:1626 length:522 start_codon:yes stop_codon:yes gene_type:complete